MIIRSQSKDMILNMECIATIYINELEYVVDTKRIVFNIETEKGLLGKYSTEEKAIKVLDMIQEAYCKMKNSDCIFCGSSIDLCKASQEKIDHFIETNRSLYVFEMPQDSEV